MTTKRTFATNFTGGDSASLKFLDHSTGVAGYTHRWLAQRQTPADAAVLSAFTPTTGTLALSANGTGPTMQTDEYANRCVRFDGVDDILTASGLSDVQTLVVVARVKAASGTEQGIFHTGGTYAKRTTADTTALTISGTSSKFVSVNPNQPKYHVFSLAATSTTSRYAIDGTAAEVGASTGVHSQVTIGRASTAIFGNLDVYEVITYPTALSLTDLTSIRTAMGARYGAALA
ncbi:hypothetical protein AB0N65_11870 [Paenarthrobacter sp. NPDC089322]|uniref:hypothetical protein n=1 Tax=Paenarthrobacter sp. NPDC089322 TaxID=3155065 RepID=UPI00342221E2